MLWGEIHTTTSHVVNYGETEMGSHHCKVIKPKQFIPWEDTHFHGSHVRWKILLKTLLEWMEDLLVFLELNEFIPKLGDYIDCYFTVNA